MKNRWKALFLAAGLTLVTLGGSVYAEQPTEGPAEQTEAAELTTEGAVEELEAVEPVTEVPEVTQDGTVLGAEDAALSRLIKQNVGPMLESLSMMTDDQLKEIEDSNDPVRARLAAGWLNVKEELGSFEEITDQTVSLSEDGKTMTVQSLVKYSDTIENTNVYVDYVYNKRDQSSTVDWDIKYPAGKLIREAGLNTLLGMGTVFIVLIFLSLVIGNIHWIPDLIEGKKKKAAPAAASAPAAPAASAAAAAPVEAEEDLSGDEELVAVIAAAIAAYEGTADMKGFRVRSIRKAKRRSALEY